MSEKQVQQHSQHFNLSGEAKQKLEQLTARRYPGKQRRQSQLVEDLIVEAFAKEYTMSETTTRGTPEREPDGLAPGTIEAIRCAQIEAHHSQAQEVTVAHLFLGLITQSDTQVLNTLDALPLDLATIRGKLEQLLSEQNQAAHPGQKQPEPWGSMTQRYKVGQVVDAVIMGVMSFGAFAQIEDGIQGLVSFPIQNTTADRTTFYRGQQRQLLITHIDAQKRHIHLRVYEPGAAANSAESVETDLPPHNEDNLPLSAEAQIALTRARWLARSRDVALIEPEDLLQSILRNGRIQDTFAPLFPLPELPHDAPEVTQEMDNTQQHSGTCSHCKRETRSQWKHCVYCGQSLARVCPACGTVQAEIEGMRFCAECGNPLE